MEQQRLLEVEAVGSKTAEPSATGSTATAPRLVTADRSQIELRPFDLDGLIPADHRARLIWQAVERLDLSRFYEWIKAREHQPGRPPTDPKVFVALWLYATAEGVGSARELERLCQEHRAYQWLRGGVPLNYHTLSDFRTAHEEALDDLFTQLLAVLLQQKLIVLKRVAQDGLRVRASAGSDSFRRRKKLKDFVKQARRQVEEVKKAAQDPEISARQRAARERVAQERVERLNRAMGELKKVEELRLNQSGGKKAKSEPRASTTDPQARNMRMGDGGYHPGYNVQLATESGGNFIVGVGITNSSSDHGQVKPMIEQIEQRTGERPEEYLVDGGYTGKQTIEDVSEMGVVVYGPVGKRGEIDNHRVKLNDSAAVAAWRKRMGSPEGKEIYKERAPLSERVNADVKTQRTLNRMLVRGMNKVLAVALWNALAYNILRWISVGGMSG